MIGTENITLSDIKIGRYIIYKEQFLIHRVIWSYIIQLSSQTMGDDMRHNYIFIVLFLK